MLVPKYEGPVDQRMWQLVYTAYTLRKLEIHILTPLFITLPTWHNVNNSKHNEQNVDRHKLFH